MNRLEKPTAIQKAGLLVFCIFFGVTPVAGYVIRKMYGQAVLDRVSPYWGWCGVGFMLAFFGYVLIAKYGKPHA